MKRIAVATLAAIALSACSTIQNQYVDASGKHGSGETTMSATMHDGRFTIADAGVTCSGTFPNWTAITVVFPITCSDGKTGSATMSRPASMGVSILAGEGTIQFKSGETRRFVFGPKS